MKKFLSINFKHLKDNNFTYFYHLFRALEIGSRLIIAGILCLIHSVCPIIFTESASEAILKIQERHKNFPNTKKD